MNKDTQCISPEAITTNGERCLRISTVFSPQPIRQTSGGLKMCRGDRIWSHGELEGPLVSPDAGIKLPPDR